MENPSSPAHEQALKDVSAWLEAQGEHRTPTINDVARLCRVSKRTVSRVINKSSQVREETSILVNAVIHKLGYLPDPQARGLAFRHSFLIGLIYDNPNPQYLVTIQEGILNALADTDFELAILRCDRSDPNFRDQVLGFVLKQKLFGIILTPSVSEDQPLAKMLKEKNCNYLRIAAIELDDTQNMIVSNDRLGARAATQFLIENGHRKIAHVSGRDGFLSTRERISGYREALRDNGIKFQSEFHIQGDYTFESGYKAGQQILDLPNPPTAIFAANDEMAAGVLQIFNARNVSVPNQFSIIGYDDFRIATSVFPKLTTVRSPTLEIGSMAVHNIIANGKLNKNYDSIERKHIYRPSLVHRDTVMRLENRKPLSANQKQ